MTPGVDSSEVRAERWNDEMTGMTSFSFRFYGGAPRAFVRINDTEIKIVERKKKTEKAIVRSGNVAVIRASGTLHYRRSCVTTTAAARCVVVVCLRPRTIIFVVHTHYNIIYNIMVHVCAFAYNNRTIIILL